MQVTRRRNVLLDFAEPKNQERPHRQDYEHEKPDQEISATGMGVFGGEIRNDSPQRDGIEPPRHDVAGSLHPADGGNR